MLPIVAIVGRPNVGKSTLFNRILKRQAAVVDPMPGVTRDRHYADTNWNGVAFTLVDTGGYLPDGEGDSLAKAVREQTMIAAEEADLVLLVADSQAAPSDIERKLARELLKKKTPVIYVANKADDATSAGQAWELPQVGFGEPLPVSAKSGYQVAELLDEVAARLKILQPVPPAPPEKDELRIAIIGAPNSGKSSLVNLLAQSVRMVVSPLPGTTRDSVDTVIRWHDKPVRLIDTAGLRRKRFGLQGLEFYCTLRALRAIDRCNVAVVLIDATAGFTQGDIRLVDQAAEKGVGVIIAVNKWDLVEKDHRSADEWLAAWHKRVPGLTWAPMLFISALTGQRAIKVVEEGFAVKTERERRLSTPELNDTILTQINRTPPPAIKAKYVRVKYISQVGSEPPKFICFTSHAKLVPEAYQRFVERLFRETYQFRGVPITVLFREK